MSYYSTAAITALLGNTVAPGGTQFRITQAGNNRVTQAGNRRLTQAGSATGVVLSSSGFAAGDSAVTGVGASSGGGNTDQLISQWTFNSDAHDSRGAHDGTLVGSPTFVAAKLGNGVLLNGLGTQYVDCGDVAEFIGLDRTYAGWVRSDTSGGSRTIFSKVNASGTTGIVLRQFGTSSSTPAGLFGYFNTAAPPQLDGSNFFPATTPPALGQLTHVALVLDSSTGPPNYTARLYKDGALFATGTFTALTNPTGVNFLLGRQAGLSGADFFGVFDDWRVYNYPLTPAEVLELAQTGGGVGPLEPVDSVNYVQVDVLVGNSPRQTWDGFGWGAGSPSDVPNLDDLVELEPNKTRLFNDLNTKVLRLVDPLYANFNSIHQQLVGSCVANGVDRIMMLGFIKHGGTTDGYTPTQLADAVHSTMNAVGNPTGVSWYVNIQNEPDGGTGQNAVTPAESVAAAKELRARLNTLGRSAVKITGCEWAKFSQSNLSEYTDGFANEPAGFIGPSGTITRGAGHCYKGCPTDQDYDQRYQTKGVGLWSGETGNGNCPHTGARFISALNHGIEVEVHHGGQLPANLEGNASAVTQNLVRSNGTPTPQWGQYRIITPLLTRGSIFRLCTCNDGVANGTIASNGASLTALSTVARQRMLRTFGTENPRINVACCKRPDGRWLVAAINTTNAAGAADLIIGGNLISRIARSDVAYPEVNIQLTVTIAELQGQANRTWSTKRCSAVGGLAGVNENAGNVNMQNGTMRFKLGPSETISLLSAS